MENPSAKPLPRRPLLSRVKPKRVRIFPSHLDQLMNTVTCHLGPGQQPSAALVRSLISSPNPTGRTVSVRAAGEGKDRIASMLATLPSLTPATSTSSPTCLSSTETLVVLPSRPNEEETQERKSLAVTLSLKRIRFVNTKNKDVRVRMRLRTLAEQKRESHPHIEPEQVESKRMKVQAERGAKQRCIFSSHLLERGSHGTFSLKRVPSTRSIPAPVESQSNNNTERVRTADPGQLCDLRDRLSSRYDQRSLFASLDTGRAEEGSAMRIRIVDMKFALSARQHLVLPQCWS